MEDKATIEINWDRKLVGISMQPMDFGARADKAVETSKAQIIAQMASKYAYDLMQLSTEELMERHLHFLSGL